MQTLEVRFLYYQIGWAMELISYLRMHWVQRGVVDAGYLLDTWFICGSACLIRKADAQIVQQGVPYS